MYLTLPGEFSTLNANSKLTVKPQPAATPKPTATSKSCQTYHGLGGIGAWNTIARPPHPGGWGIQPKQRHWPSSVGSRIPSKFQLEGQMDKACKPPVDLDLPPNHWVMSFLCRTLCSENILYTKETEKTHLNKNYFNPPSSPRFESTLCQDFSRENSIYCIVRGSIQIDIKPI